jgi:hypothetical protein
MFPRVSVREERRSSFKKRLDELVACPHDDANVSAPRPPAIDVRGR